MSAVQRGQISDSRLAILMKTAEEGLDLRGPISVDRSGGGIWIPTTNQNIHQTTALTTKLDKHQKALSAVPTLVGSQAHPLKSLTRPNQLTAFDYNLSF